MLTIDKPTARRMMIAAQGLDVPRPAAQPADIAAIITQMAVLQIDTISVVNRSPYLVLWSRVGNYPSIWLDQLLAEGAIFEAWVHEASFMPASWWGPQRRLLQVNDRKNLMRWANALLTEHAETANHIRQALATRGEVRSSDFRRAGEKRGTWWDWSIEKKILEALFAVGETMIARREGFQRVYSRVATLRPDWNDDDAPPIEAVRDLQISQTVRALGVAHERWIGDYFRMNGSYNTEVKSKRPFIASLVERGELIPVQIAGIDGPAYIHPDLLAWCESPPICTHTTLLSPFDPLVWDRKRALELFDFAYLIECYTPAAKRRYGYFTLPILYHDQLIGRVDCKAHRAQRRFEVISIHFEPWVAPDPVMHRAVLGAIRECANWHVTPEVVVTRVADAHHRASFLDVVALGV